jgi:hypothetical protein
VEFGQGAVSFCTTLSHSFLTDKGWKTLGRIKPGEAIVQASLSGNTQQVVRQVVLTGEVEPVFNLYTEVEHNFVVDGYIAHNFTHLRMLRVALHRAFIDPFAHTKYGASSLQT